MSAEFSRDHCKLAVGRILQTIGWHSINSTPLEVLTDLLKNYMRQIARITNDYANEFGQTEPNLDHLGLAFQELGINLAELEEYVTYVNFVPPAPPVPKYPIPKESNLNFLKPGSKEVVTRPIHINEHLPPMYPLLEEQNETPADSTAIKTEASDDIDGSQFKKPSDLISPEFRRSKKDEESSRPTREISSVMMTTSGYLSPACEGKLPERKAPAPPVESPKVLSPAVHVPDLMNLKKKPEKRKEKPKELLKSIGDERPPKKSHSSKEPKIKTPKNYNPHPGSSVPLGPWNQSHIPGDVRMPPLSPAPIHKPTSTKSNFNKTLAAAKAKTEKLNTTITPIPIKSEPSLAPPTPSTYHQVDKLVTEPDKKKINILKKISNVKEKHEKPPKHHMSPHMMQQTRDIVNKINLSSDITIEPINPPVQRNPDYFFDDGSPPDTPSTPKTPEIMACNPPLIVKERRKRKDKPDKLKAKKARKQPPPAHFMDTTMVDLEHNKPSPSEPSFIRQPLPPFPVMPNQPFRLPLTNFGGPGLIPHPFSTPLFPFSAMIPNMPEPAILPPISKPEPAPKVSPKNPEPMKQEPTEIVPSPRAQSPVVPSTPPVVKIEEQPIEETPKKSKEHKKDKKDKIKKKNKKEKVKDKSEKKKLKEAKKEKDKEKKKKKLPKEDSSIDVPSIPKILLKVNSPSPRPETPDAMKKLNIKPIVKKEESSPERKRETSPGLAKIAALVTGPPKPKNPSPVLPAEKTSSESPSPTTASRPPGRPRIHPLKSKPIPKVKKVQQPYTRQDAEGNTVWFCPECDLQDDGRPMIGCDGCDAWYHWVCVGIQVPPDNNENWYCRRCLAKKNADLSSKKKKRKKKNQP